jgi:AcrR family transcriptional regulator
MPTNPVKSPKQPQMGRRPGASRTRQAIYNAARARFAQEGYAATTIRKIAADAGVDASLVMQFFGSKDELFAAIMSIPPDVPARIQSAFEGTQHGVGERLTRAYLSSWDGAPRESEPLLALLRGAISQEHAAAKLRDFIQARLAAGAADISQDDTDDAPLRASLAASMLIGVVVGRRILRLPTLQDENIEALIARVAPAVQSVLIPPNKPAARQLPRSDAGDDDVHGVPLQHK